MRSRAEDHSFYPAEGNSTSAIRSGPARRRSFNKEYAGWKQPEPRQPTLSSEEEPESSLHHTLSRLAINAAERRRVRIGIDVAVNRMVENVQRLQAQFEISISVLRQVKLLQNAVVRIEAARVSQIAEVHRRVGEAVIGCPHERIRIQNTRPLRIDKASIDHQRVGIAGSGPLVVFVPERPAQRSAGSRITAIHLGHLHRRSLQIPGGDTRDSPSARDRIDHVAGYARGRA